MPRLLLVIIASLAITCAAPPASAQGPRGRSFGFGLIVGNPLGGTVKFWLNSENAIAANIGGDYFGDPRLGADYLWHFDAFRSAVVRMYAGPGLALGFGHGRAYFLYHGDHDKWVYRPDGGLGLGIRAVVGLNIIPHRTPIEIFAELGPMIGLVPEFGSAFEGAVGIRFYP